MSIGLSGLNALAYQGVQASTPPQLLIVNHAPTPNDASNINLGTFWLYPASNANPNAQLWVLLSLAGGIATWVELYPGASTGAAQFDTDNGTANESAGVIVIAGGSNINTQGATDVVTINLDTTIHWPNTDAAGATGVIYLNNNRFLHDGGSDTNTFLGTISGNFTNAGTDNTGIGNAIMPLLTTGTNNSCLGSLAGSLLRTGNLNTLIGNAAGSAITTNSLNTMVGSNAGINVDGTINTLIGFNAGSAYTGAESSNIILGPNVGVIGESNVIRIGVDGSGVGEQDTTYIAGIYGSAIGATNAPVFIDNNGQLGTVGGGTPSSTQAFLIRQSAPLNGVTGGGINYTFGTAQVMSIIYDLGGNIFIGDGVGGAATFTAPVTGIYMFNFQVELVGSFFVSRFVLTITTTARTYLFNAVSSASASTYALDSQNMSAIADMTIGDTATFSILATVSIPGNCTINDNGASDPRTWVSGYLIQ